MSGAQSTLRMFLLEERPTAVKVSDKATIGHGESRRVEWLPRSLISYAKKEPAAAEGQARPYTFMLPDWKVEEARLWEFVIA